MVKIRRKKNGQEFVQKESKTNVECNHDEVRKVKDGEIMLRVSKSVENWYLANDGAAKIEKYFIDPKGIFLTDAGLNAGVYEASVVTDQGDEILMYIGEVGKEGRGFRDRLTEHARYWIENPKFYTGVTKEELAAGYKFKVDIIDVIEDDDERYQREQSEIQIRKPYTQFNCYPKYNCDYRGMDLCIFPTYRRKAFKVARDGFYSEDVNQLFVEKLFEHEDKAFWNSLSLSKYSISKAKSELVELIEKEMPNGSELWKTAKTFVERKLGICSERGCIYSYLVKIIAVALQEEYEFSQAC